MTKTLPDAEQFILQHKCVCLLYYKILGRFLTASVSTLFVSKSIYVVHSNQESQRATICRP